MNVDEKKKLSWIFSLVTSTILLDWLYLWYDHYNIQNRDKECFAWMCIFNVAVYIVASQTLFKHIINIASFVFNPPTPYDADKIENKSDKVVRYYPSNSRLLVVLVGILIVFEAVKFLIQACVMK